MSTFNGGILGQLQSFPVYLTRLPTYVARLRYQLRSRRFEIAGPRGNMGAKVRITGTLQISTGKRVAIRKGVFIGGTGRLTIGSNTAINEDCIIGAYESVEIGSNVMIAARSYIIDLDHCFDRRDIPIADQGYSIAPVVIEDDVWIGTGAVVTKGVRIGKGAIIGANSVVTRDIPPYTIAAGVPARVVKERPE